MPYKQILLDSCSYIRLSGSIMPLLGFPFGTEQYAFYIHQGFSREFKRSSRLISKFKWILEYPYCSEWKKRVVLITKTQKIEIEDNFKYIWDYHKSNNLNLSLEDMYCLATSIALDIPLVTDEATLLKTAEEFEVKTYTTATILKLMLDNNFPGMSMDKINDLYIFLYDNNDLPSVLKKQYKEIFGNSPPTR